MWIYGGFTPGKNPKSGKNVGIGARRPFVFISRNYFVHRNAPVMGFYVELI